MNVSIDVIRIVYDEAAGRGIHVGPCPDGLGVQISTEGKENIDYFGSLRLTLHPEFAKQLSAALMACANETT